MTKLLERHFKRFENVTKMVSRGKNAIGKLKCLSKAYNQLFVYYTR